ncbi:hypothetical protein NE865_07791 [Phthorimaea operculella]|nr:hypothetical protein NE865_07791 [Phthorimaea operculella]
MADFDDEFPEIHIPEFHMPEFPKIKMPKMPKIKMPPMPKPLDVEEIRNYVPKDKNTHFQGSYSSSFSHSQDINGVKSATGGSHIIVNQNGKVNEQKVGFNEGDKVKSGGPKVVYKKARKVKKPIFEPLVFPKIEIEEIGKYVPKDNEKFVGYSSSSFSSSVNNNGVKHTAGGSDIVRNVNGKVDAQKVRFKQGDKKPTAENSDDN